MKLVCCCGASIEIPDGSYMDLLDQFRSDHAACRMEWRQKNGEIPRTCATEAPYIDPYARFRDAIREGKRVFFTQKAKRETLVQITLEHLTDVDPRYTSLTVEGMLIEGIDIPVQPTQEWLDKNGVELTGECRGPRYAELFVASLHPDDHPGVLTKNSQIIGDAFSGRRWIVRKVEKDDGFDKWWATQDYCDETDKKVARIVWIVAQEAKK